MLDYLRKNPKDMTYKDIQKWRNWIETKTTVRGKKHYQNSFANLFCAINTFCKVYKIKDRDGQYMQLYPPERIKPEHNRTSLDLDEVERLFNEAKGNVRNYAMFRTFIETGARISEIIHINVDDIKTIELNAKKKYYIDIGNRDFTPKAGSFRQSFITKETYDALQECIKARTPLKLIPDYAKKLQRWETELQNAKDNNMTNKKKVAQILTTCAASSRGHFSIASLM